MLIELINGLILVVKIINFTLNTSIQLCNNYQFKKKIYVEFQILSKKLLETSSK